MFTSEPIPDLLQLATAFAIAHAKSRAAAEVSVDDLALGCLRALSRFGVIEFGATLVDLEHWDVDWVHPPVKSSAKVSYSDDVVRVFDRTAYLASQDAGSRVTLAHLMAALARESSPVLRELQEVYGISSAAWRSTASRFINEKPLPVDAGSNGNGYPRDYLSPEDAAAELGIHVQTVRAYVRSGKLPALRVAGERAIRILRQDLNKLLEPVQPETEATKN